MARPDVFSNKRFEREEDARTMMRFVEIQKDQKRLAAAKKELHTMEHEAAEASKTRVIAGKLKKLRNA